MRKLSPIGNAFVFVVFVVFIVGAVLVQPAGAGNSGEKAVLSALDDLKVAMLKKDRAALEKIFHPDLTYGHSSATVETKAQAIAHIVDGLGWEAIELADSTVRLQGNLALVNGKADLHQRYKDKPTVIAKLLVLTVWVKGPQGWQLIARQAVRRPDDAQVIAAQAALAAAPATKAASSPLPAAPAK